MVVVVGSSQAAASAQLASAECGGWAAKPACTRRAAAMKMVKPTRLRLNGLLTQPAIAAFCPAHCKARTRVSALVMQKCNGGMTFGNTDAAALQVMRG